MAVAFDVAVDVATDAPTPATATVTATEAVSAVDTAFTSPSFRTRSGPLPAAIVRAAASAFVPPSHTASPATATPAVVTATVTVPASAVASAVSFPVFDTRSAPSPASIAPAVAFAVDVAIAAA